MQVLLSIGELDLWEEIRKFKIQIGKVLAQDLCNRWLRQDCHLFFRIFDFMLFLSRQILIVYKTISLA